MPPRPDKIPRRGLPPTETNPQKPPTPSEEESMQVFSREDPEYQAYAQKEYERLKSVSSGTLAELQHKIAIYESLGKDLSSELVDDAERKLLDQLAHKQALKARQRQERLSKANKKQASQDQAAVSELEKVIAEHKWNDPARKAGPEEETIYLPPEDRNDTNEWEK